MVRSDLLGSLHSACFTRLALLGLCRVQAAPTAQGKDGGGNGHQLALHARSLGQRWGGAVKLALLSLLRGLRRAKLGWGQRCLLRLCCSARAHRRLRGVRGSALVRDLAAMLGHWQQRVGVGTSLRWAADALACAARLRPGVKVGGGGQRRSLRMAHVAGGAG